MAEGKTPLDWLNNRLFGIPVVAQIWARLVSKQTAQGITANRDIPFAKLKKPLNQCRAAIITTGGVHLRSQEPFDMKDSDGDAGFREIPGDVNSNQLMITHKYYDHRDADKDINIIFPLERFRELYKAKFIGSMAPRHFGFMGHIKGKHLPILINKTAPETANRLLNDSVDFVLLTPA